MDSILSAAHELTKEDLIDLLDLADEASIGRLYGHAYQIKLRHVGNKVYFRGLIEFSNICRKNCFYCGIRRDNDKVERFEMTAEEILSAAKWAYESGYGSVVLQAGERWDEKFISFVEEVLRDIKNLSQGELGITLSLGEQGRDTLERWFEAGAHRYLLRIETSNGELYRRLHPDDHDFSSRLQTLKNLAEIGYQVGTGVMIGLPYQTTEDLADDIIFFKEHDVAMIGMGPYVTHKDTPLGREFQGSLRSNEEQLTLALKMIAVTRIYLRDVNIASTTALQALNETGRELGLQAGANIIMPNITDVKYRESYQLYDGKPCINENASLCRNCLQSRISSIGEEIAFGQWGDSPHFKPGKDKDKA
ncbi:MAG: [FeFe] hydrogenase H-cluster radical SAM maturase HydE [Smithellaceae bacterium]|nr:[FeFe] hydrogenase H-cluster radical SAM maturase HydE [Smithellaceae bacterium]